MLDITGGILQIGSESVLGSSGTIRISTNNAAQGLRVTESFTLGKSLYLNAASSGIDVTEGKTLTIANNDAFAFSASTNNVQKNDLGTLVLSGTNSSWLGTLTVAAGNVLVTNNGAIGGTVAVSATTGAALRLGGVTIAEPMTLVGTGIDFTGALRAVSGANITSGTITLTNSTAIGADAGASLTLAGTISGGAALTFVGGGTMTFSGSLNAGVGSIVKNDGGRLLITGTNSGFTGAITLNAGSLELSNTGTLGSSGAITLNTGASLFVDDSGAAIANRFGSRAVSVLGGTIAYKANGTSNSSDTLGALTVNAGATTLRISNAGSAQSLLTLGNLASNVVATQGVLIFQSDTTFGTAQNQVKFTTSPTLTPASTGIIQRAVVIDPSGTNFATLVNGSIAAFSYGSYATNGGTVVTMNLSSGTLVGLNARLAGDNVRLTTSSTDLTSPGLSGRTINSLLLSGSVDLGFATAGGMNLVVASGNILATGGSSSIGSAAYVAAGASPLLSTGATETALLVDAGSSLTLNASLVGTASLTKGLGGNLILAAPQYTNLSNGFTTITGGTLTLAAGTNTLWPGVQGGVTGQNLFVSPSATLNLNGNSQMFGDISGSLTILKAGRITSSGPAVLAASPSAK
jgi:autotransporter-associated beta strand protein